MATTFNRLRFYVCVLTQSQLLECFVPEVVPHVFIGTHKEFFLIIRGLKLHTASFVQDVLLASSNTVPCDFLTLFENETLCHCLLGQVMEEDDVAQHPTAFVERTEDVVWCEGILLQEIITQNLCHLKSHLIALRQAILLMIVW